MIPPTNKGGSICASIVRLRLLPACFLGEDYVLGVYWADLGIDTQVNL